MTPRITALTGADRARIADLYARAVDPAGRRFWEREGFGVALTLEGRRHGDRVHTLRPMARALSAASS